jgi:hypothetical protein
MHVLGQRALTVATRRVFAWFRRKSTDGLVAGLGEGRPAGVEHQDRHASIGKQPPQDQTVH